VLLWRYKLGFIIGKFGTLNQKSYVNDNKKDLKIDMFSVSIKYVRYHLITIDKK